VDLRAVLADQGRKIGISDISVSEWCSARDSDKFFSHRKSGGRDGRMVAYLGALP
jgi:copper oxidase (laccase) domain-containing protein